VVASGKTIIQILQRVLLVLGATLSGLVITGLGLAFLASVTILQPRPGEEPGTAWGGAIVFVGCLLCGGVLGALVGASIAIRRIAQYPDRNWSPLVWTGVALGTLIGIAIGLTGIGGRTVLRDLFAPFDGTWKSWLSTSVVATIGGTTGGLIGRLLEKGMRKAERGKPKAGVWRPSK
jgi:hypothetical protein